MSSAQDFRSLIPRPAGGQDRRADRACPCAGAPERRPSPRAVRSVVAARRGAYHGVTVDHACCPTFTKPSERAPIAPMVDAARQLLNLLSTRNRSNRPAFQSMRPNGAVAEHRDICGDRRPARKRQMRIRNAVIALMREAERQGLRTVCQRDAAEPLSATWSADRRRRTNGATASAYRRTFAD